MTDYEKSQIYVNRLKRCFLILKITVTCTVAAVAALIIFMIVAAGMGLKESDPQAFLIGVVITAGLALAFLIASFAALLIARITLTKLNKLDTREAQD